MLWLGCYMQYRGSSSWLSDNILWSVPAWTSWLPAWIPSAQIAWQCPRWAPAVPRQVSPWCTSAPSPTPLTLTMRPCSSRTPRGQRLRFHSVIFSSESVRVWLRANYVARVTLKIREHVVSMEVSASPAQVPPLGVWQCPPTDSVDCSLP